MKRMYLMGAVLLATFSTAQASLVGHCPDGSAFSLPVPHLRGEWVSPSGGVTLLREVSQEVVEVHGQDNNSYWDGRCKRSAANSNQFICKGFGKEFSSNRFSYSSTFTVAACLPLVEEWRITTIPNKETRTGRDEMVRIVLPTHSPKVDAIQPGPAQSVPADSAPKN
jgi:hypothetical protein